MVPFAQKFNSMKRLIFPLVLLFIFFPGFNFSQIDSTLLKAVMNNNLDEVRVSLENGADINKVDENGANITNWAVLKADLDILQYLLDNGADFRPKGHIHVKGKGNYYNLTMITVGENKPDHLKFLIEKCQIDIDDRGIHPKTKEANGWTALNFAAALRDKKMMDFLISLGANQEFASQKLGEYYFQKGKYEKAKFHLHTAERYYGANYGKEHHEYGVQLNNLGIYYNHFGQYDKALSYYLQSLENTRIALGSDHYWYGIRLGNLGSLYRTLGQYDKALSCLEETVENAKKALSETSEHNKNRVTSMYGVRLIKLGQLYSDMGQYNKALPIYQKALELLEKSMGKGHEWYGMALGNQAALYRLMGQHDHAIAIQQQALENVEKRLGKEHSDYNGMLKLLAVIYQETEQYDQALSLLFEARENYLKTFKEGHPNFGSLATAMGRTYRELGQYDNALNDYHRAYEIYKNAYGEEHPYCGNAQFELAELSFILEDFEQSAAHFEAAFSIQQTQIDRFFPVLSDREQMEYIKTISSQYDSYYSFLHSVFQKQVNTQELGYDLTLSLKGQVLSRSIQMSDLIKKSKDAKLLNLYQEWRNIRQLIAHEYSTPISNRFFDLESLELSAQVLESKLARKSVAFRHQQQKVKWNEIQDHLKRGEIAIEFVDYPHSDTTMTNKTYYAAMLIGKDYEHPLFIPLFEEHRLKNLLEQTENSNDDMLASLYAVRGVEPRGKVKTSNELYSLIWKPIEPFLKDIKKIYYSPAGLLHRISFQAIPVNKTEFLSDRFQLRYLSSTRQVVFKKPERRLSNSNAFLFADIHYDADSSAIANSTTKSKMQDPVIAFNDYPITERGKLEESWEYLPGTKVESELLQKIFEGYGIQTRLYSQHQATEESFKAIGEENPSPSILHVATHGFFFPDLKKDKKEMDQNGSGFRFSENPLIRSGLILAGANKAWKGEAMPYGIEDGILTAYEISNMNLANTKLVVLSACETGLGDIQGSEGVFGLQRAFKKAGVENIIMSLWQVPDEQTGELMEQFYSFWLGGMDIWKAFNKAQQSMRKKYRDPYYWAGFVLVE